MSILSVKSKTKEDPSERFFSLRLPKRVSSYLSLYALVGNVTRSVVARQEIINWYKQTVLNKSEEDLLKELCQRVEELWSVRTSIHPDLTSEEFKAELIYDMQKKGIEAPHIKRIINKLDEKD